MLMFAVQNLGAVETIEQVFGGIGHTEMEVNSVHSTIDFARKNIAIHSPDKWPVIIRMAHRRQSYIVREVEQKDIFDLHQLAKDNGMTHLKNASINWLKVKAIRVTKGINDHTEVKEWYEEEYRTVPIKPSQRQSTRQKQTTECRPNVESQAVVLISRHLIKFYP
jgi:phosphorylcholine metabolism protein LicD